MSRPSIFARVKARFDDWRRECRIQFHFDEARFAELRGFSETQRFHAIAMRNEMNARSHRSRDAKSLKDSQRGRKA